MALTAKQYADLTAKIEKKKEEAAKIFETDFVLRFQAESWYNNLIAFLDPERKDDGAYFTNDPSFMSAYMAEHWGEYGVGSQEDMDETHAKYHAAFESGDVDETLKAIQSMLGLEPEPEPVKQEEEPPKEEEPQQQEELPVSDLDVYGFETTSDANRALLLTHLLGKESAGTISKREFDPLNREDVSRLYRRNENGEYEPAFPEAADPKFRGLTEQQAVDVLTPENGYLFFPAGQTVPRVFSKDSRPTWVHSQWNSRRGQPDFEYAVPVFAGGRDPRLGVSKEALAEETRRKDLDVMFKDEKRGEGAYRFLFGSKLDHVGSDSFKTYDERWVLNVRERGGVEYPAPKGKALPEGDTVALTLLSLANPDVTGQERNGLYAPLKDDRFITLNHLEMNLDTYLNRKGVNSMPVFVDPVVKARQRTNQILTDYYSADENAPDRYGRMSDALVKGLPMLTGILTFPSDLNGTIITRYSQVKEVQNLIERHPQLLETAKRKAEELGTLDEFEGSLRKCRMISKLYGYAKDLAESELRLARYQAGKLYDDEGRKVELTPEEAKALQLEVEKRSLLPKMMSDYNARHFRQLSDEVSPKLEAEAARLELEGECEYTRYPIPEDKRGLVSSLFGFASHTALAGLEKEMLPVLPLILEHEGGMAAFDDVLKSAKNPQDPAEITQALIDSKLIPADINWDPSFDYDGAIKSYNARKTDLDTYGFAADDENNRKVILTQMLGAEDAHEMARRPFDPTNREDVSRLYRRNENGEYELAFPEAKNPGFKGLTEQQAVEVFTPENGYLYFRAGDKTASVFTRNGARTEWSNSQWNPDRGNRKASPVFADGQDPRLAMSREALEEERNRKNLDVMFKDEKRAEEVYRFLFGSKLDHAGSDTYKTYDEKWVATIRERGGTEYPVPKGKALPEDDVVALTLLHLTDPEVTGKTLAGRESPLKDNRLTTYGNFEMNLDTYLNRRSTNIVPRFVDPIVMARERTNSVLTEYYNAAEDAPDRYEKMGATLARALPMLTSTAAFTPDLNGAVLSRCAVIGKVQNLIETHPQILEAAKRKAEELGTLDVFETSLRQCRTLSKLSDFGKKSIESELRFARHQAGTLYDAEGQKVELSPKEADTLRIEAARRSVVTKMLMKCNTQQMHDALPEDKFLGIYQESDKMRATGICEHTRYPVPEEERASVVDLIGSAPFVNLDAQKREMSPVLPLLLEHEGGLAVFDDILRKARDPQDEAEITKALLDNNLIPAGNYGDPSFDYGTAIEAYSVRHLGVKPKYQTFVDGIQGTGTSPLDRAYQRNHQHGSFYGGFIVSDDIKQQLQAQPVGEFLHFEPGENIGEYSVTHRIPEMGRYEPGPGEAGPAVDYKLREYMNKATKYALRLNFKDDGELKDMDSLADAAMDISPRNAADIMEKCKIPAEEQAAFTAFLKDNRDTVSALTFGINKMFQQVSYYETVARNLPALQDEKGVETVRNYLKDSYGDYRALKQNISRIITQPEDNDTFLNFCSCETTGTILQNMAGCVNRYRKSRNLEELNMTSVRVNFPPVDQPDADTTFPYHFMSVVDVRLNGQQCTMTMESTVPPSGKMLYRPDKNPQALGLYHSVDEIRQAYAGKENYTKQYSSAEEKETFKELAIMMYGNGKFDLKPYNFSDFSRDFGTDMSKAAQDAPNAVDQDIHTLQEFSDSMAASQKAIFGSGSTQFSDLQREVNSCLAYMKQQKENNPLYLGASEKATAERLGRLSKYARAYLGIKQDEDGAKKSLNANGEKRYALVSELKKFTDLFEPRQPAVGTAPESHADGMDRLRTLCEHVKTAEDQLKGRPSAEQSRFKDFSVAVMGLREIENINSVKKLSAEIREKAVNRLIRRAEKFIDAEKIAAEKAGSELSAEAKSRIGIAEELRTFAAGFKAFLPKEAQAAKNKAVAHEAKGPAGPAM